jgi:hypothetical protein
LTAIEALRRLCEVWGLARRIWAARLAGMPRRSEKYRTDQREGLAQGKPMEIRNTARRYTPVRAERRRLSERPHGRNIADCWLCRLLVRVRRSAVAGAAGPLVTGRTGGYATIPACLSRRTHLTTAGRARPVFGTRGNAAREQKGNHRDQEGTTEHVYGNSGPRGRFVVWD